jgi:lactate dehydrogenase-like 2-hydroxyacid dehydrogenase
MLCTYLLEECERTICSLVNSELFIFTKNLYPYSYLTGSSLKVVGTMSVGNDHVDVLECKRRQVFVATTPDVASDSAAELSVALLLMTTRRLAEGM